MGQLVDIRTKIKAILDIAAGTTLPEILDYIGSQPEKWPAAMISYAGGVEHILDTVTNESVERFVVRLIYPVEEGSAATTKWLTLLDTLRAEFRKDDHQTLDGVSTSFMVAEVSPPIVSNDYTNPVIVFDLICQVKTLSTIN